MDTTSPTPNADSNLSKEVFQKIGTLTRQLHDSLNELGYTEKLQGTMQMLPDAKSRLSYISRLTGEAAEKVLNRVEQAKAEQDRVAQDTRALADLLAQDPGGALASGALQRFVQVVERSTQTMDVHLTEIMLAQDFHDLTGQVISRVVTLAAVIEEQLVELLLQTAPAAHTPHQALDELSGPVVDPENHPDVVTDQTQVDDLLASLGF